MTIPDGFASDLELQHAGEAHAIRRDAMVAAAA